MEYDPKELVPAALGLLVLAVVFFTLPALAGFRETAFELLRVYLGFAQRIGSAVLEVITELTAASTVASDLVSTLA